MISYLIPFMAACAITGGVCAYAFISDIRLRQRVRDFRSRAFAAEEALAYQAALRSNRTRRGNLTKSANRKALVAAKTAELQGELA